MFTHDNNRSLLSASSVWRKLPLLFWASDSHLNMHVIGFDVLSYTDIVSAVYTYPAHLF